MKTQKNIVLEKGEQKTPLKNGFWVLILFSFICGIYLFFSLGFSFGDNNYLVYTTIKDGELYSYVEEFNVEEVKELKVYSKHFNQNGGEYLNCFEWKTKNSGWLENSVSQKIYMGEYVIIRRKKSCTHDGYHRLQIWNQKYKITKTRTNEN